MCHRPAGPCSAGSRGRGCESSEGQFRIHAVGNGGVWGVRGGFLGRWGIRPVALRSLERPEKTRRTLETPPRDPPPNRLVLNAMPLETVAVEHRACPTSEGTAQTLAEGRAALRLERVEQFGGERVAEL